MSTQQHWPAYLLGIRISWIPGIAAGALKVEDANEHVFRFFRTIKDLPKEVSTKDFLDLDQSGKQGQEAINRLGELTIQLFDLLSGNVQLYEADWNEGEITSEHIEKLCEDVYSSLSGVILEEIRYSLPPHHSHLKEIESTLYINQTRYNYSVRDSCLVQSKQGSR